MKHLKTFGLVVLAAVPLTALLGAGTASATTLEVGGVQKNESVTFTFSTKPGTSSVIRDTFGFSANPCTSVHLHGNTINPFDSVYIITSLTSKEDGLSFSGCDHTVTVHNPGQLFVEWTSGTNGRVYSSNAEITTYSTIHGTHINCKTPAAGVVIGTLTGVASGHATMDINATLNCGPHLSSAKWIGTYTVTSPTGLGVVE